MAGTSTTGPGGVTLTLTDRAGVGGGLRITFPDHGVLLDPGDDATATLSEPMFYTQWVFVDIDLSSEGFAVTGCLGGDALCGGGTAPAGVAVAGPSRDRPHDSGSTWSLLLSSHRTFLSSSNRWRSATRCGSFRDPGAWGAMAPCAR